MSTATLQLHDYQKVAVEFLRNRRRAALLLDMGLGKTCISLMALTPEMLPVLVNAPKRVAENVWDAEVYRWRPDLKVKLAVGTPAQRKAALASDADIIVIGRDNLADAEDFAPKFKTHIIDELSGFKSRASNRWKSAKRINVHMDQVWGLTGTPSPNGLLDLWAQMYLIDGGEALGTGITGFRERYFVPSGQLPSGVITGWDPRPGAPARIHTLLERSCLSMTTEGRIDLPPVTDNDVLVPLLPAIRRIYKTMKDDLVVDLDVLGGVIHSAVNAAVLSSRLSQITAGFLYPDDREFNPAPATRLHKEKANVVREIVDGTGSPVIVAYRFQEEYDILKEALGDLAHDANTPNLQKRWNAGELPVLLAHPASVGHGLNLQTGPGHTMVWATLPWSLEEYMQMNKRLARQGQTRPVTIHHLISPKTVDPAIKLALQGKKSIQDAIMDHLESPL
jgi:SNF2 family DNA or RNA helicase